MAMGSSKAQDYQAQVETLKAAAVRTRCHRSRLDSDPRIIAGMSASGGSNIIRRSAALAAP